MRSARGAGTGIRKRLAVQYFVLKLIIQSQTEVRKIPHIQGNFHGGFISARYRTGTTTAWRMLCTLLMQMLGRAPILVVAKSPTAETLIRELRQLTRIAVAIDSCESALEMMEGVNFGLVIVEIRDDADWCTCRRIVSAARAPVAVVTRFLARNRHFREFAFRMGVAAYMAVPYTPARLRALLRHIEAGRGGIELVRGAAYCEG